MAVVKRAVNRRIVGERASSAAGVADKRRSDCSTLDRPLQRIASRDWKTGGKLTRA